MNEPQIPPTAESTGGCCDWKKRVDEVAASATKIVREEPGKALGFAFITGLLCTVLPVGRLLGGIIRLAFALVPPALLVLGGMKVWEEIEKRTGK
jgi:hypothetical protein